VSNIIKGYRVHTNFAAYMAFSFIIFLHVLLVPFFLSFYIWLYVLYTFNFVSYVFLLLFMYSYCYVCSVLYFPFSVPTD
jgi:hypothetical protein